MLSGRYARARGILEHALETAEMTGEGGLVVAARAGLLPCLAWAGDWHILEQHLGVLQLLLAQGVGLSADAASCQKRTVALANAAGRGPLLEQYAFRSQ